MSAKAAGSLPRRLSWIALVFAVAGAAAAFVAPRLRQGESALPRTASRPEAPQEAQLREQVRKTPEDPSPRLALISLLLERRRNYDALDAALEASRAVPGNAPILRQLAEARFRTAHKPEAVETLRPLARTGLGDRLQMASYLAQMGRRQEAVRLVKQPPVAASPADAIRAGQICLEAMSPASAVKLLRPAVELNPYVPEMRTLFGLALMLDGQYSEAARGLEETLSQAPTVPTLRFYAGAALRLAGDPKRLRDAEAYLANAAQGQPENGLFLYELGVCRMRQGDWSGARGALEAAGARLPDTPEVHRDLARVYEKLGAARAAAITWAHYFRTVNDPPSSVKKLEPLIKKDKSDVDVGLLLASAEYAARVGSDASTLLKSLHQRWPNRPEVLRAQLSLHKATRSWKEALAVVESLARLTPGDPTVETERADVLHNLGEFAEEEKVLARLCERQPAAPEPQYRYGQFLARSSQRPDRVKLSEARLRRALALRPEYPEAHLALGELLESAQRPAEAVLELRTALDTAPDNRDALRALGRAYLKLGDRARSDDAFGLLRRFQGRADEEARLETQMNQFVGREATPAYQVILRQRRKNLARYLLETGFLARAAMELEMLEHAAPADVEVRRLLEPLYGHGRRFQRQLEMRRFLSGGAPASGSALRP